MYFTRSGCCSGWGCCMFSVGGIMLLPVTFLNCDQSIYSSFSSIPPISLSHSLSSTLHITALNLFFSFIVDADTLCVVDTIVAIWLVCMSIDTEAIHDNVNYLLIIKISNSLSWRQTHIHQPRRIPNTLALCMCLTDSPAQNSKPGWIRNCCHANYDYYFHFLFFWPERSRRFECIR